MRNPGLEQATRVAVRSYAPAVSVAARTASSVHSPPPCGEGSGVGVVALVNRVAKRTTPLPNPPPQGGRELTEFVAPTDPNSRESAIASQIDDIDTARAQEYALLSVLLARAPDAALLSRLAELRGDASPLGLAHAALAEAASRASLERVEREYFDLFIGLGRGELLPYGSYYLSGFLHERPLARLRAYLSELRIERAEGQSEPEDHAAILCEIMAGIISGRLPAPAGADRELFEHHLAPWVGRFFADLERAEAADLYRHVGVLGRVFVDIETQAFALPS